MREQSGSIQKLHWLQRLSGYRERQNVRRDYCIRWPLVAHFYPSGQRWCLKAFVRPKGALLGEGMASPSNSSRVDVFVGNFRCATWIAALGLFQDWAVTDTGRVVLIKIIDTILVGFGYAVRTSTAGQSATKPARLIYLQTMASWTRREASVAKIQLSQFGIHLGELWRLTNLNLVGGLGILTTEAWHHSRARGVQTCVHVTRRGSPRTKCPKDIHMNIVAACRRPISDFASA